MRILYIIDSLNIGGAEMLLFGMLEAYQREHHQLEVAYFTDGPLRERIQQLGIRVTRISTKALKDPGVLIRTSLLIKEMKPNVVHTHLFKSDLVGQISALLMQVPVRVLTLHNTDPWRKNYLFSAIMRMAVSGSHKMIAVSPIVEKYVIQTGGYPEEKIIVIENGINLAEFSKGSVKPIDKSEVWQIPKKYPTVGIIGRLHPQKGHIIFLKAAQQILKVIPNARFIIIGDGSLRQELEQQTRYLNVEEQVKFAGRVKDIPGALAALDLVIFSSIYEGLPVALLEAMAMEKPIISTAVGGIPAVISDGQDGLLIPPNEPQILAHRSVEVLRNPILAQQLGRNARHKIQHKYDAEKMQQKIMALYQSLSLESSSRNTQWIEN